MIYTVTLNPTLDITYYLEEITFEESVKALKVEKTPGGKGVNVSRALKPMGTDSIAIALLGGIAGVEVIDLLHHEALILQIVRIQGQTRTNVIILDSHNKRELVIRSEGPPVLDSNIDSISELITSTTEVPEIVVLSGSLPGGVEDDAYHRLTMNAKSRGSRVVLDSEGGPLREGIKAGPMLIKPNKCELEGLAGCRLDNRRQMLGFCRELLSGGIEIVVVSLGGDGAIMVTRDVALDGKVPVIDNDTVGAGDSMVAGIIAGLTRSLPIQDVFHMGLAFSVAAVLNKGPGLTTPETYKWAAAEVRVEPITDE